MTSQTDGSPARAPRRLGYMESIHARTHGLDGAIQFSLIAQIEGAAQPEIVHRAWRAVYEAHPLLGATISGDGFVFATPFEAVPIAFELRETVDWVSAMTEELGVPLESRTYSWRVTVLVAASRAESHVIVTFHHAVADGTAGVSLLHQFVDAYNALAAGAEPALGRHEFLEAVETYLPAMAVSPKPSAPAPESSLWRVEELVEPSRRRQLLIHCAFDRRELSSLLEACRRHGTKLTGLLTASMMLSFEAMLAGQIDDIPRPLVVRIPRNARPLCSHAFSETDLGDYITMQPVAYTPRRRAPGQFPSESEVWALAVECTRQYLRDPLVVREDVAAHVDSIMEFVSNRDSPHFRHGPILSNMGDVQRPSAGGALRVVRLNGAIRNAPLNSGVALGIFTYAGEVSCLFNFNTPLVRVPTAERFVRDFVAFLRTSATLPRPIAGPDHPRLLEPEQR